MLPFLVIGGFVLLCLLGAVVCVRRKPERRSRWEQYEPGNRVLMN